MADLSLDGKVFRVAENAPGGEADEDTRFDFRQIGNIVWSDYSGGAVLTGRLVGTLEGRRISFKYVQANVHGVVRSGEAVDDIEVTAAGKLRLLEHWMWPSADGERLERGTLVLEEE